MSSKRLIFGFLALAIAFCFWQTDNASADGSLTPAQVLQQSAGQKRQDARKAVQGAVQSNLVNAPAGATAWLQSSSTTTLSNPLYPPGIGFNQYVDYTKPNFAYSPNIRKFVDGLPGLGIANANNLGQYIPVANPDTTTYPGCDYYELSEGQYSEKLNSDLPPTLLRGYHQTNSGDAGALDSGHNGVQYLGAMIIAQRDRAVRLKVQNNLPLGNLFLPVDTTIMGAGLGPDGIHSFSQNRTALHLHGSVSPWISDGTPQQWWVPSNEPSPFKNGPSFMNVPDMIGNGNGKVPNTPGDGYGTFYYPNPQSARLEFYHDHSWGTTRQEVYGGMAAPYLITDDVEKDLIEGTNNNTRGFNNTYGQVLPDQSGILGGGRGGVYEYGIPLVIQDKSFVNTTGFHPVNFPSPAYQQSIDTRTTDPLWFTSNGAPGYTPVGTGLGNLWFPHEYMPIENIFATAPDPVHGAPAGNTPYGRWDYGPFLIPATIPNNLTLPTPSIIPEAFGDTALVNGCAYPHLDLPAEPVRFRILSIGNDRWLNLQVYKADPLVVTVTNGGAGYMAPTVTFSPPASGTTATGTVTVSGGVITGITVTDPGSGYTTTPTVNIADVLGRGALAVASIDGTEVKMVPASPNDAYPQWSRDGRNGGVPDPLTAGPPWLQIGNEGGFLAQVAVIPQQPIDFDYNRQDIPLCGVSTKSLFLAPAQRADVILDLSQYKPGDRLIVYNDAPGPLPNGWPFNDLYTNDPDMTAIGGPRTSPPGFGPNNRTIMQIRITGPSQEPNLDYTTSVTNPFDSPYPDPSVDSGSTIKALKNAIPAAFAATQDKPIVPQLAYNKAFPGFATNDIYCQSVDQSLNLSGSPTSLALGTGSIMTTVPGAGYATAPTVTIVGGGGSGAAATAGLNPCGGVTLLTAGSGYITPPAITIGAPGAGGVTATAVATITGGQVTAITIVNPGSNYSTTVAPTVTIAAPPVGVGNTTATASAFVATAGAVGSINVTNGGSGYTSQPQVYLIGGGGQGAAAIAMLPNAVVMDGKGMTEGFDTEYGRVNVLLGSTPNPLTPNVGAGAVVGINRYIDPPTEIYNDGQTVLWRITHLGVDSHAMHFHLFNLQVVNRVDATNVVKPPYPDEIGWRETIRTNPMEDLIVAFRPTSMQLPFQIPNSSRLLDPSMPAGPDPNFVPVAPPVGIAAVPQQTNVLTNFGWEYVWHCHLLGHEENDMMRTFVLVVPPPPAPTSLADVVTFPTQGTASVALTWASTATNASGYTVQRATNSGFTANVTTFTVMGNNTLAYADSSVGLNAGYYYRVQSFNGAGVSAWSNVVHAITVVPPTNFTAVSTVKGKVTLNWVAPGSPSTFTLQRLDFISGLSTYTVSGGLRTLTQSGLVSGNTYWYRILTNVAGVGSSAYTVAIAVTVL